MRERASGTAGEPGRFARWLKETRKRRGLSQRQAGIKAGIDPSSINKYERDTGAEIPRRDTVLKIARALETSEAEALRAAGYLPDAGAEETLHVPPNAQVVRPRPGVTIILDPAYFVETAGPDHEADRAAVIRATEEMEQKAHETARRDDMRESGGTARDDRQEGLLLLEGGGGG